MRLLLFIAALLVASIQQIPVAYQIDEVKIAISLSGFLAGAILASQSSLQANLATLLLLLLLVVKSFYAHLVADWSFNQTLTESLQELRFSFFIIFFPQILELLRATSSRYRLRLMNLFVAGILLLDVAVLFVLPGGENLIIGERSYDRYVSSVLIPLVLLITLVDDDEHGQSGRIVRRANYMLALAAMLFHTVAITTSRVESVLAAAIVLYIMTAPMVATRKVGLVAGIVVAGAYLATNGLDWYELGGRNYVLAAELLGESLPWGFGAATDLTVRVYTGAPANFYLADYGILFYFLRYGVFGLIFVVLIAGSLTSYVRAVWERGRSLIIIAAVGLYILLVPVIDYGSLGGAFLFALMLRRKAAPRMAGPAIARA